MELITKTQPIKLLANGRAQRAGSIRTPEHSTSNPCKLFTPTPMHLVLTEIDDDGLASALRPRLGYPNSAM